VTPLPTPDPLAELRGLLLRAGKEKPTSRGMEEDGKGEEVGNDIVAPMKIY